MFQWSLFKLSAGHKGIEPVADTGIEPDANKGIELVNGIRIEPAVDKGIEFDVDKGIEHVNNIEPYVDNAIKVHLTIHNAAYICHHICCF